MTRSWPVVHWQEAVLKLVPTRANAASRPAAERPDEIADLVQAVRDGQPRATRTFITAIGPHLLRVVRRVLGYQHPEVEDVTQEAVWQVLDALPNYRGECTVVHFACRVAVLVAMNARRRGETHKRAALDLSRTEVDHVSSGEAGPDTIAARQQLVEAARELLTRLPEPQAEALALHCVLGYTVAEIASSSAVSAETVRSRLRLAKQALRRQVQSHPALLEIVEGGR